MLLTHFAKIAERTLTGVIFAVSCTMAVMHFGQSQIFDPLVMLVAISIAIIFRHDRNLLSLLLIIVAEKAIEEITWQLFDNILLIKIPLYIFLLTIVPRFSSGWLRVYLLLFVGSAITAEIYWYITGYSAPWIFWQVWMCVLAVIARRAIGVRVFWMIELFKSDKYDFMRLDDHMYNVFSVLIAFYSLVTIEYYLRHFLDLEHITYAYYSLSYFTSFTSSFVIYMLVVESFKHLKGLELDA